jgi:hypothetical protein
VGDGQGFTGTTYETVRQTYATYADLLEGNVTFFDVLTGQDPERGDVPGWVLITLVKPTSSHPPPGSS